METFNQRAASPADALDRSLFLVGALPKDSDEDFSEGEDSMGGDVLRDQRDLKKKAGEDEADELDSLDQELEEGEDDEDDQSGEDTNVDDRDDDLDEEERTYRKRFADTKADRDEKAKLLREAMLENARLKALQTVTNDVDEEALAREIQEGMFKEVSQITESDPNKRSKAAYDIVAKHIALATKKAVDLSLKKVADQQHQQQAQTEQQKKDLEIGKRRARIALKEVGLDPDKYYANFEDEVSEMLDKEPEWFNTIPPEQHYIRMAKRVKEAVRGIQEKRKNHQREANGQLNGGSRVPKRPRQESNDDESAADTLTGAIQLLGRRNLARGNRAFELTHRR